MSELNKETSSIEKEFAQMERSMVDPHVERVLSMARMYSDLLCEETSTAEQQEEIISELDAEWGSYFHTRMKITGHISTWGSEYYSEKKFYEDLEVISNGFYIREYPMYVDDELVATKSVVNHHILIPITSLDEATTAEDNQYVPAVAEIDDVMLDLPLASFERATAWLSENYPELTNKIDERMLNADGTEADAIVALKGVELPIELAKDTAFARTCVEVYINECLQLDPNVPYSVQFYGKAISYAHDDSREHSYGQSRGTLAYVPRVNIDEFGIGDDVTHELSVVLLILAKNRTDPIRRIDVALDGISSCTSIRSAYYNT